MIAIVFSGMLMQAQDDIIVTLNNQMILNCNISKVEKGNLVYYTKDIYSADSVIIPQVNID